LGGFEYCTDSISSLCVAGGEKLQAFNRGLGAILRRR
jgi:hypothetical protein